MTSTLAARFPKGRTVRNRNSGRLGTIVGTLTDTLIDVRWEGVGRPLAELIEDLELIKYRPGHARIGEPTPQSDPDMFTVTELKAEIRYLLRLNARHGTHPLRVAAYLKLDQVLRDRGQSTDRKA